MTEEKKILESYFDELWPILRSITGKGVRQTHEILRREIPLCTHEVATGTKVLDWTIPREWSCDSAKLFGPDGTIICDVDRNNLELLNYSAPFSGTISREKLDEHLFSIPELPDAIPYVTSYYKERWGFCLPHSVREQLPDGEYQVEIATEFRDGYLTYSDATLEGEQPQREVLISTYTCHPSLANNELSGPLVSLLLFKRLQRWSKRRLSYRFVFIPETIGSIAYLAEYGDELIERLEAGLVVTCVGDDGRPQLKLSRRGDSIVDRVSKGVLTRRFGRDGFDTHKFFPDRGSDERQYCSPGFNLPVASITRSMYGEYPEYHTSLDNKSFIDFSAMVETVNFYEQILRDIDSNVKFVNQLPYGEPMLGPRGLYPNVGGAREKARDLSALMWVLNYSDGDHDLVDISEMSGHSVQALRVEADKAEQEGVLKRA